MALLSLRRAPGCSRSRGLLACGDRTFACAIGRSGISVLKREGDGATPAGTHRIVAGYFRRDRMVPRREYAWLRPMPENLGWCDAPVDTNYNRPVRLPYPASHEIMQRSDRQYDVCLVLDWNLCTRSRNRGSAIFLHLTREEGGPTQGCVAVSPDRIRRLLSVIRPGSWLRIHP